MKKRTGVLAFCLVAALYGWGCAAGVGQKPSEGTAESGSGRNAEGTESVAGSVGSRFGEALGEEGHLLAGSGEEAISDARMAKPGSGQEGKEAPPKGAKPGVKERTAAGSGEEAGKKARGDADGQKDSPSEEERGLAPVVSLPAQMQNEERVAPPEPEPGKLADQADVTVENAADEIPRIFSTAKESLAFSEGGLDFDNGEEYTNQDGDVYGFDLEGKLVSYQSSMDTQVYVAPKTSQDACREAAECYLTFLAEDPSYYAFDRAFYHTSQHVYSFVYRHYVQGMPSNDQINIDVHDALRSLVSFRKPRPGVFCEMDKVAVEEGQIFQKAQELFRQEYPQEHMEGAKLNQITVYQEDKKYAQGRIGYMVNMDYEVEDKDICACETVRFVPFEEMKIPIQHGK